MTLTQSIPPQAGILVSTAITAGIAGRLATNHAEDIVVATAITAGLDGVTLNHAEDIVATAITAGVAGSGLNHAERLVLR